MKFRADNSRVTCYRFSIGEISNKGLLILGLAAKSLEGLLGSLAAIDADLTLYAIGTLPTFGACQSVSN